MDVYLQFLLCGYNGSGYSSLISVEKQVRDEVKVFNRILINAGDGTQRICSENRIKLFAVSTIIITSLCPQNLSGFSGVFLSLSDLGVGEVTVYGPPGLNVILNLMLPFINRKHPMLKIIEVEERRSARVKGGQLDIIPMTAMESNKVLALACSFMPIDDSGFHFFENTSSKRICFFPISIYFPTNPSLEDCAKELLQDNATKRNSFVFIPLTSDSQPIHQQVDRCHSLSYEFDLWRRSSNLLTLQLRNLCHLSDSLGFLLTSSLHRDITEFKFAQWGMYKLNYLANPLFPFMLDLSDGTSEQSYEKYCNCAIKEKLVYSLPLMKIILAKDGNSITNNKYQLALEENEDSKEAQSSGESFKNYNTFLCLENTFRRYHHQEFREKLEKIRAIDLSPITVNEDLLKQDGDAMTVCPIETLTSEVEMTEIRSNYGVAAKLKAHLLSKRKLSESLPPLSPQFNPTTDDGIVPSMKRERSDSYFSDNTEPLETPSLLSSGPSTFESTISSYTNISAPPSFGFSSSGGIAYHNTNETYGVESPLKVMRITPKYEPMWSPSAQTVRQRSFFSKDTNLPELIDETTDETPDKNEDEEENDDEKEEINANYPSQISSSLIADQKNQIRRVKELLQSLQTQIPPPNPFQDLFHVTFLGTGCATPSKSRNSSSIMLRLNSRGSPNTSSSFPHTQSEESRVDPIILLDIGEGTTAQIFQSVSGNIERFDEILLNIRVIWISHHHADHATGLPLLIHYIRKAKLRKERREKEKQETSSHSVTETANNITSHSFGGNNKKFAKKGLSLSINTNAMVLNSIYEEDKVLLIANEKILKYYEEFLKFSNLNTLVTFCSMTNTLYAGMTTDISKATNGIIKKLQSVPVIHCQNSFGLVMEFSQMNYLNDRVDYSSPPRPYRVVYSGDCRPSQSLIRAGQNCDLLIHEATFTYEKLNDAVKKRHSTIEEAIHTAIRMNAKHLILTHFSQRYPVHHAMNPLLPPVQPPTPTFTPSQKSESPFVNVFSGSSSGLMLMPGKSISVSSETSSTISSTYSHHRGKAESVPSLTSTDFALIRSYQNVSFAYDFLKVSFPSQISVLPEVTKALSEVLYELDKVQL